MHRGLTMGGRVAGEIGRLARGDLPHYFTKMNTMKPILLCTTLLFAATACEDGSGPPPPPTPVATAIVGITASDQTASVGTDVIARVRVLDQNNQPMPGAAVTWTVAQGGGTVNAASTTDATGEALATWRLGNRPGAQRLTASIANGASVSFTATATVGALSAITIAPLNQSIEAGATLQVTATGADALGNAVPIIGASWTSSNQSVATISSTGLVTAVGVGTTQIRVAAGGREQTTNLTVTAGTVQSVTVTPTARSFFQAGDTVTFSAVVRNTRNAIVSVPLTWSSSNTNVAVVDQSGRVRAVGEGSAIISATAGTVSGTASVGVSFGAATIETNPANVDPFVFVFDRELVTTTLRNAAGEPMSGQLTWTSSNENVAIVIPADPRSAYIYSTGAGSATITVTSGLARKDIPVTVGNGPLTAFIVPQQVAIHARGATAQLGLAAYDAASNPVNPTITWQSSDPSIAPVSQTGVVTNLRQGNVEIRALVDGQVVARRNVLSDATILVPRLSFTSPQVTLFGANSTYQLQLVYRDTINAGTPPAVTYTSSNGTVASVSESGVVTAIAAGSTTITATGGGHSANAVITVVGPAAQMSVSPVSNTLTLGVQSLVSTSVNYSIRDAAGTLIPFAVPTLTSSDPNVVRVIGTYLHAVGRGTATITASYPGITSQTFIISVL